MIDPRSTSPGSNMPAYAWLKGERVDYGRTGRKLQVLRALGVPYTDAEIASAAELARAQGAQIRDDLALNGARIDPESELVALIGYLQRLGRGPQFRLAARAEGE